MHKQNICYFSEIFYYKSIQTSDFKSQEKYTQSRLKTLCKNNLMRGEYLGCISLLQISVTENFCDRSVKVNKI